jgi:type IV fimbrial biogenesis protein FimT
MEKQPVSSSVIALHLRRGTHQLQRARRGVTLIELVVTMGVVAVLSALAAPSWQLVVHSTRLVSASNSFFSTLFMARSEAIKRNSRVVVCTSGNGQICAASGGWEQGWLVFHDANNNAQRDSSEVLIHWTSSLSGNLVLSGNATVAKYVSFDGTGATRQVSGAFQAGTLTLCRASSSPTQARKIIINAAGRPRTQTLTASSCG